MLPAPPSSSSLREELKIEGVNHVDSGEKSLVSRANAGAPGGGSGFGCEVHFVTGVVR